MKKESIASKILSRVLIAAIVIIAIAAGISYYIVMGMKTEIESGTKDHFGILIKERINAKMDVGISNAVSLSKIVILLNL